MTYIDKNESTSLLKINIFQQSTGTEEAIALLFFVEFSYLLMDGCVKLMNMMECLVILR